MQTDPKEMTLKEARGIITKALADSKRADEREKYMAKPPAWRMAVMGIVFFGLLGASCWFALQIREALRLVNEDVADVVMVVVQLVSIYPITKIEKLSIVKGFMISRADLAERKQRRAVTHPPGR